MGKGRLEAFSDGVIAVIITIMVLEMKVPHGGSVQALAPLIPVFLSYVLSFIYIGIYWNNHHHMLHACSRVTGAMLGQSSSVVLAVADSVYDRLDGRKSLRAGAIGAVWLRFADGRDCLLDTAATDHCIARAGFGAEESGRR